MKRAPHKIGRSSKSLCGGFGTSKLWDFEAVGSKFAFLHLQRRLRFDGFSKFGTSKGHSDPERSCPN
eukprot:4908401-Amphidinium_carterae.1